MNLTALLSKFNKICLRRLASACISSTLSSNLKFKTFILDEFFDNYDKDNIIHIYNTIYNIAEEYGLQLFITTNKSDYLFDEIDRKSDIKILEL